MGVSLKELAKEAGVSIATVSLALKRSSKVADKTRQKIQQLAQNRNYQPNMVARSLAGGGNRLIGVLIDSRAPRILFQTIAYIEKVAVEHGYRIMIGEAHDNVRHLHEIYQMFRQYRTEGVICFAHDYPGQDDELKQLFEGQKNIIFAGKPRLDNASYVAISRDRAIAEAVEHLHEQGYSRVGLMCNVLHYNSSQRRIIAFKKALFKHGISDYEADSMLFYCQKQELHADLQRLISERILPGYFDAVIMENDRSAATLCKLLKKQDLLVPEDVGVIGSDNDDICSFCTPELSSIDDEEYLKASSLVKMLLDIIEHNRSPHIYQNITLHSKLVIRESSAGKHLKNNREVIDFKDEKSLLLT